MNKELLGIANTFKNACDILLLQMNEGVLAISSGNLDSRNYQKGTLLIPIIVNASFACELFLKCILPDGTHGHELDSLFSSLDQESQNEIMFYTVFTIRCSNPEYSSEQFWKDLKNSSNNFVRWRYLHEGNGQKANLQFITTFLNVLSKIAFRRKTQENPS